MQVAVQFCAFPVSVLSTFVRGEEEAEAKCLRWLLARFGGSKNALKASIYSFALTSQPASATDPEGLHPNSCITTVLF